jgi:SAM-dependent methyltransferase
MKNIIKDMIDKRKQNIIRLGKPQKVLILGCGGGESCDLIRTCFGTDTIIHGIDLVKHSNIEKKLIFHNLDLEKGKLPFQSSFFDLIVSVHVIEYLDNIADIKNEIKRVIKPEGNIYIETTNWTTQFIIPFTFYKEKGDIFNFYDDYTHKKPFTKYSLYYLLKDCGFHDIKIGSTSHMLRIFFDPFIIIYSLISKNRGLLTSSVWNIFFASIFAIGTKKPKKSDE